MDYDNYYFDCKEIKHLFFMCMKLPPSPNKCKTIFDMWIKCSYNNNIINNIKY